MPCQAFSPRPKASAVIVKIRSKEIIVIKSDTCAYGSMLFRGETHSLPLDFQKKRFTLGKDGLPRPSSARLHQHPCLSETSILLFPV